MTGTKKFLYSKADGSSVVNRKKYLLIPTCKSKDTAMTTVLTTSFSNTFGISSTINDLPFISPGFCETGAKISASNTSYILKYADFVRKRKYFGPSQGPF